MGNEHIVHVIKKVTIFVYPMEHQHNVVRANDTGVPKIISYYATIYDGSIHLHTVYEESYDKAHDKAVDWIHEQFTVPDNITTMVRNPQDYFTQYTDEHGRVHSGYRDQEEE